MNRPFNFIQRLCTVSLARKGADKLVKLNPDMYATNDMENA